jgi:hypothetical protein
VKEQLTLLNIQLQFERHRREAHAERNRRLLGKSRTNRALEEHNSALVSLCIGVTNDFILFYFILFYGTIKSWENDSKMDLEINMVLAGFNWLILGSSERFL